MSRFKKLLPCLVVVLTLISSSSAIDRTHYLELAHKLDQLAKQKDWQGARAVLTEIGRELPAPTPRYFLIVASIEMHLDHKAEALQWMKKYAATGLSYDMAKDDDLKPLLADEAGQKLAAQMKENNRSIDKAEFVCTLPQADTMPEDITYLKAADSKTTGSFHCIQHSAPHGVSRIVTQGRKQGMRDAGAAAPRRRQALAYAGCFGGSQKKSSLDDRFGHAGIQRLPERR